MTISTRYGGHYYVSLRHGVETRKAQIAADQVDQPQLIHPHPHGEPCGVLIHTKIIPHDDPVEVLILSLEDGLVLEQLRLFE